MTSVTAPDLVMRREDGTELSTLVWWFAEQVSCVSTAAVGGGFAQCSWIVNAQVCEGYRRTDLHTHAAEIAAAMQLSGNGTVMFTAVDVRERQTADVGGALVTATVGLRDPSWAADVPASPQLQRRSHNACANPSSIWRRSYPMAMIANY